MPSGRTHDAITFLLAVPSAMAGFAFTHSIASAAVICASFLFGGLMFGPDLDTVSVQHSRWSVFRSIWLPYRAFFKHRSRFSHGLIFGALIRVVYFLGVITILVIGGVMIWNAVKGGRAPDVQDVTRLWKQVGDYSRAHFGQNILLLVFLGTWLGAASHTFTDVAGTFIKTGRVGKML